MRVSQCISMPAEQFAVIVSVVIILCAVALVLGTLAVRARIGRL